MADHCTSVYAEESLGQIAVVQAELSKNESELHKEILELQDELNRNKDPNRMQLIQEMISASPPSYPVSLHRLITYPSRTSSLKCLLFVKRLQNQRQLSALSQKISKSSIMQRKISY